ncbi:hypothetical protein CONPUDRAFT_161853 [Coniophora puteana RWD-64-598 SS2]|uniref:MYND-type domain-containing protein n=1 Tax=Coniophora puteana (strain RWD-64-598) TaxID=741705 RepID=A0A5M3N752_CONPW|nr:uncharacterized protein CONPUDRAFT_161853 [Coniophora puteana RWD-64-598 SS2]EIW87272.1 hypothetical protein CONPUDRAFT_161853 [Coniophora puteana RWD-64-598 SS2]
MAFVPGKIMFNHGTHSFDDVQRDPNNAYRVDNDRSAWANKVKGFPVANVRVDRAKWVRDWDKGIEKSAGSVVPVFITALEFHSQSYHGKKVERSDYDMLRRVRLCTDANHQQRAEFLRSVFDNPMFARLPAKDWFMLISAKKRRGILDEAVEQACWFSIFGQDARMLCPEILISAMMRQHGSELFDFYDRYFEAISSKQYEPGKDAMVQTEWWSRASTLVASPPLAQETLTFLYDLYTCFRRDFIDQFIWRSSQILYLALGDDLFNNRTAIPRLILNLGHNYDVHELVSARKLHKDRAVLRCEYCECSAEEMGSGARFLVCGACKRQLKFEYFYCSKECQRLDWPQHKVCCGKEKVSKSREEGRQEYKWSVALVLQLSLQCQDENADYFLFKRGSPKPDILPFKVAFVDDDKRELFREKRALAILDAERDGLDIIAKCLVDTLEEDLVDSGLSRESILQQLTEEYEVDVRSRLEALEAELAMEGDETRYGEKEDVHQENCEDTEEEENEDYKTIDVSERTFLAVKQTQDIAAISQLPGNAYRLDNNESVWANKDRGFPVTDVRVNRDKWVRDWDKGVKQLEADTIPAEKIFLATIWVHNGAQVSRPLIQEDYDFVSTVRSSTASNHRMMSRNTRAVFNNPPRPAGHSPKVWFTLISKDKRRDIVFKSIEEACWICVLGQDARALCPEIIGASLLKRRGLELFDFYDWYFETALSDPQEAPGVSERDRMVQTEWWTAALEQESMPPELHPNTTLLYELYTCYRRDFIDQFVWRSSQALHHAWFHDMWENNSAVPRVIFNAGSGMADILSARNLQSRTGQHCETCDRTPGEVGDNVRFLVCGACKQKLKIEYYYCSKECQREDWPDHKVHCGKEKVFKRVQEGRAEYKRSLSLLLQMQLQRAEPDVDYFLFKSRTSLATDGFTHPLKVSFTHDDGKKALFRATRALVATDADRTGIDVLAECLMDAMRESSARSGITRDNIIQQLSEEYEVDVKAQVELLEADLSVEGAEERYRGMRIGEVYYPEELYKFLEAERHMAWDDE